MQTMFSIILPQTIRRVIPTVTSDFITSYKDTSLLSSVGVMELMMYSKNLTAVTGNITPYMAAAIYYLIVTLPLIKIVSIVEKHLAAAEHGGGPRPKDTAKAANAKQVQASSAEEPGQTSAAEQASTWSALMSPFTSHPLAGGAEDVN
jgi:polar amino acid transport system substrate-binding protein